MNRLTFCVVFLVGAPASAHDAPSSEHTDEYQKISITENGIWLAHSTVPGTLAGKGYRRRADKNQDQIYSPQEIANFAEEWSKEISGRLTVAVDGMPGRWQVLDKTANLSQDPTSRFAVDVRGQLCLPDGTTKAQPSEHSLVLSWQGSVAEVGIGELAVDPGPHIEIVSMQMGSLPASSRTYATWRNAVSPARVEIKFRSANFRSECSQPISPPADATSRLVILAVAIVLGGAACFVLWRAAKVARPV